VARRLLEARPMSNITFQITSDGDVLGDFSAVPSGSLVDFSGDQSYPIYIYFNGDLSPLLFDQPNPIDATKSYVVSKEAQGKTFVLSTCSDTFMCEGPPFQSKIRINGRINVKPTKRDELHPERTSRAR
jgi:hypothetical protein